MSFLYYITTFIVDEWLYSISWGAYHAPIAIFIMLFLYIFVMGMRIIPAVFLALLANISAVVSFSAVAMLIAYSNTLSYALQPNDLYHPLIISVGLGLIYTVLQTILFFIVNRFYKIPLIKVIAISFLSNLMTALCVYAIPNS